MSATNSQTVYPYRTLLANTIEKATMVAEVGSYVLIHKDEIVKALRGQPAGPPDIATPMQAGRISAFEQAAVLMENRLRQRQGWDKHGDAEAIRALKNAAPQVPARSADLAKSDPMRQRSGPAEPVSEAGEDGGK